MINKKQYATVFGFILLTIIVIAVAVKNERNNVAVNRVQDIDSALKTYFEGAHLYILEDKKEKFYFKSKTLEIEELSNTVFELPSGRYKLADDWVKFEALSGSYDSSTTELKLRDEVKFNKPDSNFKARTLYLNNRKSFLEARGNVRANFIEKENKEEIFINSNYLSSWMNEQRSLFIGNVKALIKRDRRYEGEVKMKSQRLEFHQSKSLISLEKNVEIDRNTYHLEAQKGDIYLESFNKKLKYYELSDDIKLVETFRLKNGKERIRRAYAEKLDGFIAEGKIVLLGTPRVEQGNDVIKGYQITLRENVDVVEVDDSQSSFDIKREK